MSKRPGEFEMIRRLFAPLSRFLPGAFDLADDAALIAPPDGMEIVLTTDAVVEGVHFLKDDPPDTIAKKALRVNLSDLAAKGAAPHCYLLVLALPPDQVGGWPDMEWLEAFARGLAEDQTEFGVALAGGDTTATAGPLTIAVTALGYVVKGGMVRRAGAKPGDLVFVTGSIGDAAAGLALSRGSLAGISQREKDWLIGRYRLPAPRLAMGRALIGLASAALDVSDGLLADLGHIAEASRVRIEVEAGRVPMSDALHALDGEAIEAICKAATAGDDYEIAFTAPPVRRQAVLEAAKRSATDCRQIGTVVEGEGVILLDADGQPISLSRKGYTHF